MVNSVNKYNSMLHMDFFLIFEEFQNKNKAQSSTNN